MASGNGQLSENEHAAGDLCRRWLVRRADIVLVLFVASSLLALGLVALQVPGAPPPWSAICRTSARVSFQSPALVQTQESASQWGEQRSLGDEAADGLRD